MSSIYGDASANLQAGRSNFFNEVYFTDQDSRSLVREVPLANALSYHPLLDYLINTHTFFYGKVGFYERIIRKIREAASLTQPVTYIHTSAELPKRKTGDPLATHQPLILLPTVDSDLILNTLLAKALSYLPAVWLVGQPSSIQQHLLLGFHNFFITNTHETETNALQKVIRLPNSIVGALTKQIDPYTLFVTDFEPILQEANSYPDLVIRLVDL